MIVNSTDHWIWFSIPKCGTCSMYAMAETRKDWRRPVPGQHPKRLRPAPAGYLTWVIIRNPYARMVSLWRSTEPDQDLVKFIHRLPDHPNNDIRTCQVDYIHQLDPRPVKAVRLEDVGFFMPRVNPASDHVQNPEPWTNLMTPRVIEAIDKFAMRDFEEFGFVRIAREGCTTDQPCGS